MTLTFFFKEQILFLVAVDFKPEAFTDTSLLASFIKDGAKLLSQDQWSPAQQALRLWKEEQQFLFHRIPSVLLKKKVRKSQN